MARPDGYTLGLDAGQTSTRALLCRLDGTDVFQTWGGPVDHFRQAGAAERNAGVIRSMISALCRDARIGPQEIVSAVVGWTAIRPHSPARQMVESMLAALLPAARVTVLPDYAVSLAGASGGEPGIVVIAGGGSIAYGVTPDGRDAVVGGLGYLLGDEGSAFDIGRRAVAAAARSSDGRGPRTLLEELVRERFALDEVREITHLVYAADFSRSSLARLAPDVAALAEGGDGVAGEIMRHAGRELGIAAVAVARILGMVEPIIYTAGGVFRAGELVLAPLRAEVEEALQDAAVRPALYPPVVGALLLARRAQGATPDGAWLSTVTAHHADAIVP